MKPKILSTLPGYTRAQALADLMAGLTVTMVAVPLSLAIAIASGAHPATGLVTAVIAGFLISALGGSRVQIGGPTGAFIVVVHGIIAQHGYDGLLTATLMAGAILVVAGAFRAGSLVRHVPEAVINGFTIGIAIIIGTSQLANLGGLSDQDLPAEVLPKLAALAQGWQGLSLAALAVGLGTMALIVVLRRAAPRYPGLIVAVGLGSAAVALLNLPVETLYDRFGPLPNGLPAPVLPDLSPERLVTLFPSACVIAFLAGVESLLSAMVADRMTGAAPDDRHRPNAEVMAQGWANLASPLFGGLPATGAIARTATNIRAGARTPLAGIVHAVGVLAVMMLAAPLAGYLAMPALAALLILTAWNMAEPQHWRRYLTEGPRSDRVLLVVTMVLTVLVDLTVAISVGVGLGMAIRLARRDQPGADWTPPDR